MKLFKVMEDNDIDERVVKEVVHLLVIFSPLYNVCHFFYAPKQIVWDIKHFDSCEVHKQSNMICIESREPSLIK